jgi:hypothetical protein
MHHYMSHSPLLSSSWTPWPSSALHLASHQPKGETEGACVLIFSPPPSHSSLPPSTSYSLRHAHGYAYIWSIPEITAEAAFQRVSEHIGDPQFSWGDPYFPSSKYPSHRPVFLPDHDYPPTNASDLLEDIDVPNLKLT